MSQRVNAGCKVWLKSLMNRSICVSLMAAAQISSFGIVHHGDSMTKFRSYRFRFKTAPAVHMISSPPRRDRKKSSASVTEKSASSRSLVHKDYNATWSDDNDEDTRSFARESPFPATSPLFINLAQSQLELLSHSLVHNADDESNNIKPGTPKTSSMALYLPRENQRTGQLEFVTAVSYPNPERVFIASASSGHGQQSQISTLMPALQLPGFSNAKDLIPNYPFISASDNDDDIAEDDDVRVATSQDNSVGVSVVEEISPDASNTANTTSLSVTLFSGLDTLGVLIIWPFKSNDDKQNKWSWSQNDKLQVSRAAKSLALALSIDNELVSTKVQSEQFRMAFADSLHQIKNPITALRTFGKLLQRQLAEDLASGPSMRRVYKDVSSDDYDLSRGRRQRQAMKLAEDMVKQGERVVDLIQPMDALANKHFLLPPSTSRAIISLYEQPGMPILGEFEMEMVFPQDVLGPLVYASQAIGRENGIEIEAEGFDQDSDVPGVTVSTKHLIEATTNILDNAIKYVTCKKRGPGRPSKNSLPRIKVTMTANEPPLQAGCTLFIEDNGPGIDECDMERVFDRGYRGEKVRELIEGNGLGLSMSSMIVQRMGGILDVLDDGPSHLGGATIRIILFR